MNSTTITARGDAVEGRKPVCHVYYADYLHVPDTAHRKSRSYNHSTYGQYEAPGVSSATLMTTPPGVDWTSVTDDGLRPTAASLLPVMFDERHRLRLDVRRRVVADLRCPAKRHLLVTVVRTQYGLWVAARNPSIQPTPDGGWKCGWFDDLADLEVTCTCRRIWVIDKTWLVESGTGGFILGPAIHGVRSPL